MDNTIVKNITSQSIDKTAIKSFAVYARNKLIKDIKNKAAMIGVTESGIQKALPTSTGNIQLFDIGLQEPYRIEGKAIEQRNGLIRELKKRAQGSTYLTAYENLIEEVAYTWFNRIIAIRFMEVNNYMPDRMRVLSSGVEGINEPEFVTHIFETSFEFREDEKEYIIELKTDGSNLAMDELFQYLFIKQCNALIANLPELFEKTNDYTELLLTVSYNDVEGVIYKLVHDVPEANFDVNGENGNGQVEIIGWLYQFYNTEPKATVFGRPASKKIEKQDVPAATQLFTPEWIVKYMVENSLGRLWIEKLLANGDSRTEKQIADNFGWKYYLPEAEQDEDVRKQLENIRSERKYLSVEDIRFLDPAMGSFHIGIYAFNVYMQLYESEGYTAREAARLIVKKNLHGLDIDKRASQLSYFTCMMQARKYNRRILEETLQPNVYEIPESNHINREHLSYLGNDMEDKEEWDRLNLQVVSLLNNFIDAKEYGSLMNISDKYDFPQLRNFVLSHPVDSQISLLETVGLEETQKELIKIISVAEIISKKYDAVITNPPYMSSSGMDKKLSDFAKKYYPDSKSDMFAMFIEKCEIYTLKNGYFSMITQQAWMFLSSYKKLRLKLLRLSMTNMVHLGARAFEEIGGEVVQTTAFVIRKNAASSYKTKYVRLVDFKNQKEKEKEFVSNKHSYSLNKQIFSKIPGSPIVYWLSEAIIKCFENITLNSIGQSRKGMATGLNKEFVRSWNEVNINSIGFVKSRTEARHSNSKWFPYANGGGYRRWYGYYYDVVNWGNDGYRLQNEMHENGNRVRAVNLNLNYIFKEGVSWNSITSLDNSFRILPSGFLFSSASNAWFGEEANENILGFLNSKVSKLLLKAKNPSLNANPNDIGELPITNQVLSHSRINELVKSCISISKNDWDSFETSWDFSKCPLLIGETVQVGLKNMVDKCEDDFMKMKSSEEELNQIFINMFGLEEEISHEINDKDVTIHRVFESKKLIPDSMRDSKYILTKQDVIKGFISYAVGCMLGRYSLDSEGLAYGGGEWDQSIFTTFLPDKDNVISLTGDGYFEDDIIELLCDWLKKVYGYSTLEENLDFIANALGGKNISSREVIRNYFLKDFFNNHCKIYQKRPIYWLYDSGKQNGFKALVYMHRYDEDTTGKVRVDYLHQVQRAYERTIVNLQEDISNSKDAKESTQLQKQLEKITKQLKECRDYDERLGHMALERVAIDLDDGVKVNYDKVQTDSKGKFHQILAKIK